MRGGEKQIHDLSEHHNELKACTPRWESWGFTKGGTRVPVARRNMRKLLYALMKENRTGRQCLGEERHQHT